MKLEIYDSEDGDWTQVLKDGKEVHAGHDVPVFVWVELLEELGAEVVEEEKPSDFFC